MATRFHSETPEELSARLASTARARWAKTTPLKRKQQAAAMANKRWKGTTAKERSAAMRASWVTRRANALKGAA